MATMSTSVDTDEMITHVWLLMNTKVSERS